MKLFWQIIAISFLSISIAFAQNSASQFRSFVNQKDFEKAGEVAQNALNENPNDFELAITVGDVYFELEEFNSAFDAYSRAKNINSKDNSAAAKVANALVALNRPKEAIDDLKKLLDKDKRNMDLLIALANAYLANGETRNAEMQVTNARSIDSKNPNVFSMLGKIYFEQNVWELARTNYEEALKLDDNNVLARQQLAEVYWKLAVSADNAGETDLLNEYLNRSLEQCNILVQKDEKDANSWRLKGQIHFNANQNLEAAQSYNKFLELRPNNYRERWRLAELLAKNGVCAEALEHLKMVISATHQDMTDSIKHQAKLYLGTCYFRTQDFNNAIATLLDIDKKTALDQIELSLLARAYLSYEDTTNSLIIFDRLLKVAGAENCHLIANIARIYNSRKDFDGVIRTVNAGVNNCPVDNNTPYLYYLLGTAYFELKRVDDAIAALQKAIEINPKYYWAYIYLGDIYFSQKNVVEGERQFNFVIEDAKSDPETFKNELNSAYSKLAGIALDAKKYKDLERVAKRWLESIPDENEFAHLYLAVAYQGSGEQSNACRHYREVLKINPDNKTARDNLRSLGC
jgi:superkiller protein 3